MERTIKTFRNEDFLPEVVARVNQGKRVRIPLRGYSMRPFLEDGRDNAVLIPVEKPLKVGQVVLGQLPDGRYALHRIIRVGDGKVQMLGDGNLTPDPVITEDNVLASVYSFYRKGREKEDLVSGRKFQVYSWCWMKLRPIRRYLLYIYRKVLAISDKVNKKRVNEIEKQDIEMKIKNGFEVSDVCGEHFVMGMGEDNIDFTNVISLNDSSLFIWEKMNEGIDTIEGLVKALMEEYDVDEDTAARDVTALVNNLLELKVIEK